MAREMEKATKAEEIILSKRGRRYGTLVMAILGVLETVNPSNGHIYNLIKMIGGTWGF